MPLEGKSRTVASAIYPLPLLKSILQGIADTANAENFSREIAEDEYCATLSLSLSNVDIAENESDASAPTLPVAESEASSRSPLAPCGVGKTLPPSSDGGGVWEAPAPASRR